MENSKKLKFSKFRPDEFEQLCQLLRSIFQTSSEDLASLYQKMDSTFDDAGWPSPNFVPRDFFQSRDLQFQEAYQQSPSVAVDLPSFLELDNGDQEKPTIVVLGQDPKSDQSNESILIGTPYGLHCQGCREQLMRTKLYFEMVHVLMSLGYRVYLTDIFKVWVCNPQRRYHGMRLPKVDRNRLLGILESELSIMEPVAVVTWGRPSTDIVSQLNVGHHLSFPHPSGAANGAWQQLMGKSPSYANKLAYWELSVNQALSHNSVS